MACEIDGIQYYMNLVRPMYRERTKHGSLAALCIPPACTLGVFGSVPAVVRVGERSATKPRLFFCFLFFEVSRVYIPPYVIYMFAVGPALKYGHRDSIASCKGGTLTPSARLLRRDSCSNCHASAGSESSGVGKSTPSAEAVACSSTACACTSSSLRGRYPIAQHLQVLLSRPLERVQEELLDEGV